VLGQVPRVTDENVLVGLETADDAGVYRLTPECALVHTVDFFTPIVDDPSTFGAIAAANSLSDIYAMGARPVTALAIVAFPAGGDPGVLAAILTGGAEKIREAGCTLLGGHSVKDPEIKFGYAITGVTHPDRVLTNSGAQPGDALVFTKRIGTGVIQTALKQGIADPAHVEASIQSMLTLNKAAGEAMREFDGHGCTDVTGFGLLGHAREMALASGVTVEIEAARVGFLPGALEYARRGAIPGGLKSNRSFFSCDVEVAGSLEEQVLNLLHDPQTSGGLLISLPEADAAMLEKKLAAAYRIGRVVPRQQVSIRVI